MTKDPYKYFRIEARELLDGLSRGVLELEKAPATVELVGRLLRFAHTLKGAARVVKQPEIAELAHSIEDVLAPYRERGGVIPGDRTTGLFRLLDAASARLAAIDPGRGQKDATDPVERRTKASDGGDPPSSDVDACSKTGRLETARVEIAEMDALLEGVAEASVKASSFRRHALVVEQARRDAAALADLLQAGPETGSARGRTLEVRASLELRASLTLLSREFSEAVDRTERELEAVREKADRLRLVPASDMLGSLERTVRDAAHSLDKRVEFEARGGECRLDAHVLSPLSEALLHVVRNAVAHGIETRAERSAAGKAPSGRVELSIARRGSRVTFRCVDDGQGIDVEAIRRVALRRGLISPSDAGSMNLERAVSLLFRGGVSTAQTLTEMSGRGIGLDVVREVTARLKGEVRIESERGRGTSVEIDVPVSLSSLPALLVEAEGISASVPLDSIAKTVRLAASEIARSADAESIVFEGKAIPFVPLAALLGGKTYHAAPARAVSAVIVRFAPRLAALGVDRVRGTTDVVVRPLPASIGAVPGISGASFDPEGNPRVVLDPRSLVEIAYARRRAPAVAPKPRPPVLVIDDSLTTRMLEQSILESAGYEVHLATSAEEGLEKAKGRTFGVFVVDVEMPGMDGYEFVALTRKDPVLGRIPAILVTSRGSAEDRRRGAVAGAYAYIVKGEFDQGRLLGAISELIG
jgi:two-component system chemotaxis sensor kinase CheA